ncbi:hypothetical protein [Flavobacterium sp.]|nr:hypothetical protein [Flavobacterium sp.]
MKLSLDALRERAEMFVSDELLTSITGGTQCECHNGDCGKIDLNDLKKL